MLVIGLNDITSKRKVSIEKCKSLVDLRAQIKEIKYISSLFYWSSYGLDMIHSKKSSIEDIVYNIKKIIGNLINNNYLKNQIERVNFTMNELTETFANKISLSKKQSAEINLKEALGIYDK